MQQLLKRHLDCGCAPVTGVMAEVTRPRRGVLALRYLVTGASGDLVLPPPAAPSRADRLWRHTCFEAFVRAGSGQAYYEFNFAPSSQWAAYRFDGYRQGMALFDGFGAPHIEVRSTAEGFELTAALELDRAADLPTDAAWRLGLSAVIEAAAGGVSHWALAHPPGRADFHHPDCFALQLPAPGRP